MAKTVNVVDLTPLRRLKIAQDHLDEAKTMLTMSPNDYPIVETPNLWTAIRIMITTRDSLSNMITLLEEKLDGNEITRPKE